MSKKIEITYKQFENFLQQCGYSNENTAESHKTFVHKPANSIILVPHEQPYKVVPESIAAAAFKSLIESNVTNQEAIDALSQPATILLSQNEVSRLQKKALRLEKEKGSLIGRFFKKREPVVIISNEAKLS